MIAVIADDLTGAAEIAGIGLRYNLAVELSFDVNLSSNADLLIIATDTRSKTQVEAVSEMIQVSTELKKLKPQIIFKKVDSVLRGHIVPEITGQLDALDLKKALIVPANPDLGRTIVNGTYYIHNEPISQTGFSMDPEFPMSDSDVLKMLRAEKDSVKVQKIQHKIPSGGLIVGELAEMKDLRYWVEKVDRETLIAGGSAFFSALLESLKVPSERITHTAEELIGPQLFVSGTAFNKSAGLVKGVYCDGGPVSYMPDAIRCFMNPTEEHFEAWAAEIRNFLIGRSKAIIAINPETSKVSEVTPLQLRERMALIVKKVFMETDVVELIIEGGATASAILRELEYKTLVPVDELAPGVIRNRVVEKANTYVTLKPGSYQWPEQVWQF